MEPIVHQASLEAALPAPDKTANPLASTESKAIIKEHDQKTCSKSNKAQSLDATDPVAAHDFEATTKVREQANPIPDKEAATSAANACISSDSKAIVKYNGERDIRQNWKKAASSMSAPLLGRLVEEREASDHVSRINHEVNQEQQASTHSTALEDSSGANQAALDTVCQRSIKRVALRSGSDNVLSIDTIPIGMGQNLLHTTGTEMILSQSDHDVGAELTVDFCSYRGNLPPERLKLELRLYFDPNSDYIVLANDDISTDKKDIVVRELPISSAELPTTIGSKQKIVLRKASNRILWSGEHILDIDTFPRRYISLNSQDRKPITGSAKRTLESSSSECCPSTAKRVKTTETGDVPNARAKRAFESSPPQCDLPAAKRAKTTETGDVSSASAIVHTQPSANEPVAVSQHSAGSSSGWCPITDVCHPLESLQLDSVVKIANASKREDYTIVHKGNIANQPNSLVFKARHSRRPGKLTAVKLWRSHDDLRNTDSKGAHLCDAIRNWLNEASLHSRVSQHAAIVSLYDFDARLLTLHMEHIDAPSLQYYCRHKANTYCTLDISDAKRMLCDMVKAVNFIHSQGIIHNDIKPANILYSKDRGPVLIDFGCAAVESAIHNGGSRWYIPPELADNRRGRPGDIFALGVVFLFFLRKIPLPESHTPPLRWEIYLLQERGPEGNKARREMEKWMRFVVRASKRFGSVLDEKLALNETVMRLVPKMVSMEVEERITGPEIIKDLEA